VTSNILDI